MSRTRRAGNRGRDRAPSWLTRHRWLVSLGLFVLAWQAVSWIFRVPAYLLPSPAVTAHAVASDAWFLGRHVAATAIETLGGFGVAVGPPTRVGVGTGVALVKAARSSPSTTTISPSDASSELISMCSGGTFRYRASALRTSG